MTLEEAACAVYLALGAEPWIHTVQALPAGVYPGVEACILVDTRLPEMPGRTQLWQVSCAVVEAFDEAGLVVSYQMALRRAQRRVAEGDP